MDIFIKLMIMLSVFWVAVNALMKFFPQYATQLPLSVYPFYGDEPEEKKEYWSRGHFV